MILTFNTASQTQVKNIRELKKRRTFDYLEVRRVNTEDQKQPSRGVFKKRCSESMQKMYRRTPMPKCDFNKAANRHFGKLGPGARDTSSGLLGGRSSP